MAEADDTNAGDDAGSEDVAPGSAQQAPVQPIVAGIGASAGGIDALRAFFSTAPANSGIAYVVVVHLSPEHRSELAGILGRCTSMPVTQVTESTPLLGDRVFVIPPDRRLQIDDQEIAALPFDEPRGRRAPIDLFFRSLAVQHGDGFGIVLSGGGSDGSVGVRAIKEGGGLVLVQEPAEAEFDSMPRAAIATGVADLVLPVREMGARIAEAARLKRLQRPILDADASEWLSDGDESRFGQILGLLHARTGHDFVHYKGTTVRRRIARRMQVCRTADLADYLDHLRSDEGEARSLFQDLLISVTSFFRDPESWDVLADRFIPRVFEAREGDGSLRVWVAGCASGEEAYSMVILLLEEAARRDLWPEMQVFATDLDESAIAHAREGRYPAAIEADVSPERLRRFFTRDGEHYTVTREVRDRVMFAQHSLLRDPPFTRLDLLSCRNLLIYLDRELQEQVCAVLHYALRPGGYLFLGSSETAEGRFFQAADKGHRVFRAREAVSGMPNELPDALFSGPHPRPARRDAAERPPLRPVEVHNQLLERLAPPSVAVDGEGNVIHLSETAGRYLLPPAGPLGRDLSELVRPELRSELRAALFRAIESGVSVLSAFVPVQFNGTPVRVAVLVRPRPRRAEDESLALVTFLEGEEVLAEDAGEETAEPAMKTLREELRVTRQRMRISREEHDATVEELRAANEELQSINEEHRSTAEELETSREELQSINEELQTVNAELQTKLEEVRRTQSDLENLMAVTEIGILFLDRSLCIRRFTNPIGDLFNITAADRGRAISDFTKRLEYDGFEEDARRVLRDLVPVEREVETGADGWSLVRIRPFRTVDERIDGVIATFVDITARKRADIALRAARDYAQRIVDTVREPLVVLSSDMQIRSANLSFYRMFQLDADDVEGRPLASIAHDQFDLAELRDLLGRVLPDDVTFTDFEMAYDSSGAGEADRKLRLNARRLDQDSILLAMHDVTMAAAAEAERLRFLARSAQALAEAEEAVAVKTSFMATMSHELRTPLNAIIGYAELLEGGVPEPIGGRARKHAERIRLSSRHLLRLIDEMLAFSRLEAGREKIGIENVDLATLLREVTAIIEPLALDRQLAFAVEAADAPETLETDPHKLRQVLVNLAANAVKFTERGRIGLRAHPAGSDVVFEVEDTGVGIREADLERLFEPFWQGDSTLTRSSGGAGLGLAIAHRLTNMLGGRIDVQSEVGKGSLFRVTLPAQPHDA